MSLSKGEYFSYSYKSYQKYGYGNNNFLMWEIGDYNTGLDEYDITSLFSVSRRLQEWQKGKKGYVSKEDAETMSYVNERSRKMYNKITGREIDPTNEKDKIFQKWSQLIVTALTEGWFGSCCDEFNNAEIIFNDDDGTISVNIKCAPSKAAELCPEDMNEIISSDNWEEALRNKTECLVKAIEFETKLIFQNKFEEMCEIFMYGFESDMERYFFKEYLQQFWNSGVVNFNIENDTEAWKTADFNWNAEPENPGTVGYPASGSDKSKGLSESDMLYPVITALPMLNKYKFDMAMRDRQSRNSEILRNLYDNMKLLKSDKKYYLRVDFRCNIETAWKIYHGIDVDISPYLQSMIFDEDRKLASNNNIFYGLKNSYKILPYYAGLVKFA